MRMDHHCPWVGNCVGFGNHRYFIQTVFYVLVASTLFLGFTIPKMADLLDGDKLDLRVPCGVGVVLAGWFALSVLLGNVSWPEK